MDVRYFQEFYMVEIVELDDMNRCLKSLEAFYSENQSDCESLYTRYCRKNIPARLKKVYAEVDIDGAIIDVVRVIEEIANSY